MSKVSPLDRSSSRSVQHYIDTGRYLTEDEVRQDEEREARADAMKRHPSNTQIIPLDALVVGDSLLNGRYLPDRITDIKVAGRADNPSVWVLRDTAPKTWHPLGPLNDGLQYLAIPTMER